MSKLVLHPTSTAQWHALINEAQLAANYHLEEQLESYLVFLLMRFTDQPQLLSRVIATEFLESQHHADHERHMRLRDVGDQCLLFSGLFPHIAERRHVRISYFVNIGRSSYLQMSEMKSDASLYSSLSEQFVQMMDILQTLRTPSHHANPLQTFDLWSDTGSKQAQDQLNPHDTAISSNENPANNGLIIH